MKNSDQATRPLAGGQPEIPRRLPLGKRRGTTALLQGIKARPARSGRRPYPSSRVEWMSTMYLSAERVAIANRAVLKTFEQSSVVWQTIPHWDIGDRGQTRVRGDVTFTRAPNPPVPGDGPLPDPPVPGDGPLPDPSFPGNGPLPSNSVGITDAYVEFRMTLGQATAQTPDALLAAVIARTVLLAKCFDAEVLDELAAITVKRMSKSPLAANEPMDSGCEHVSLTPVIDPLANLLGDLLGDLLDGRKFLEDSGFRAPSCLIASTAHYRLINQLIDGVFVADDLLKAASVGSLYRSSQLDHQKPNVMLMLGRRQDIAHRCAAEACAGEEPVDLAVSVPPSLEVIGENDKGEIEMGVRVRYAARVKDERGVVVIPLKIPSQTHDPDRRLPRLSMLSNKYARTRIRR